MKKLYIVQTEDEWNNTTLIGFFTDLKVAEKEIKESYKDFKYIDTLDLKEYPSTFEMQFNTDLEYDEETGEYLRVFGYIISLDAAIKELQQLKEDVNE